MAAAQPLIDHDRIREWADARGAKPACVKGTGGRGDVGMIRLDFPGYSGAESLQKISWAEWFRQFDENGLALMVQDTRRGGQPSNFSKLVSRSTVAGALGRRAAGRSQAIAADRGTGRKKTGAGRKKTGARKAASASASRAGGGSKKTGGARRTATSRRSGGTRTSAAASSRATPARKKTAARKTGRKK